VATPAAQQIVPLAGVHQLLGHGGEGLGIDLGQDPGLGVLQHPVDGRLGQTVERAHDLVHADASRLGLGDGHLLDGVLQVHAGGVQLLHQFNSVQQLERRGLLARQPALQEPADHLPRVQGVEVLRADAERLDILAHLLRLGLLGRALGEDGDGLELAGLLVESFLGHLHRDRAALGQHLLGGLQGAGAVFRSELQSPGRAVLAARHDLEMH